MLCRDKNTKNNLQLDDVRDRRQSIRAKERESVHRKKVKHEMKRSRRSRNCGVDPGRDNPEAKAKRREELRVKRAADRILCNFV